MRAFYSNYCSRVVRLRSGGTEVADGEGEEPDTSMDPQFRFVILGQRLSP